MTGLLDHKRKDEGKQIGSLAVSSKLEAPEFLLFLVITFLLWSVGFVDLLAHPAPEPIYAVVGPYSRGVAALLGVYVFLLLIWLAIVLIPGSHIFLFRRLAYIQDRNWLALGAMAILGVAIWHILTQPNWLKYPGLSTTILLFLLLMGAILLLWRWHSSRPLLFWRKAVGVLVLVVVMLELVAQGLAFAGALPGSVHLDGGYAPQGRVYHNREGFGNGWANSFGWYYPDFSLEPGSHRVGLIGDTYIQALQIDPQQHLGVLLQNQLGEAPGWEGAEVLALGHPGYGAGLYLDLEMLDFALSAYELDEIIVFMHLGNDLRNLTTPSDVDVYFSLPGDGTVEIDSRNFGRWHDVAHYVLTGYEPYHPLRVITRNYLTPTLARTLVAGAGTKQRSALAAGGLASNAVDSMDIPGVRGVITRRSNETVGGHRSVMAMDLLETPGWSNFLFEKGGNAQADEAHHITQLLLQRFHDYARERDIQVRLVTIPVFPAAFYQTFEGSDWTPELGDYDLFLPERRLVRFAQENGIPVLAMGHTMLAGRLTTEQIQSFHYAGGTGHLTPQGHAYFAGAIDDCFYAAGRGDDGNSSNGCIRD